MENRQIERHEKDDASLLGVNAFAIENSIVAIKNERNGDIITTYLDFFDTDTEVWTKMYVNDFNESLRTGSALYVMYTDGEYIYLIQDIYDENGNSESHFIQLDSSLNELKRVVLRDDVKNFMLSGNGRIIELKAFGDYLYLRDLSGNGFLGKIENEKITSIKIDRQFLSASSLYFDAEPIFFLREGNTFFTLDRDSGQLTDHDLSTKEGHSLLQMWTENDIVLVIAWDSSRLQIQYFGERAGLSELEI